MGLKLVHVRKEAPGEKVLRKSGVLEALQVSAKLPACIYRLCDSYFNTWYLWFLAIVVTSLFPHSVVWIYLGKYNTRKITVILYCNRLKPRDGMVVMTLNHYFNQYMIYVNKTLRPSHQWDSDQIAKVFCHENALIKCCLQIGRNLAVPECVKDVHHTILLRNFPRRDCHHSACKCF